MCQGDPEVINANELQFWSKIVMNYYYRNVFNALVCIPGGVSIWSRKQIRRERMIHKL